MFVLNTKKHYFVMQKLFFYICNNRLHPKCSNVSNTQFAELASSSAPYYCNACVSNTLPINAVTNTNLGRSYIEEEPPPGSFQ